MSVLAWIVWWMSTGAGNYWRNYSPLFVCFDVNKYWNMWDWFCQKMNKEQHCLVVYLNVSLFPWGLLNPLFNTTNCWNKLGVFASSSKLHQIIKMNLKLKDGVHYIYTNSGVVCHLTNIDMCNIKGLIADDILWWLLDRTSTRCNIRTSYQSDSMNTIDFLIST